MSRPPDLITLSDDDLAFFRLTCDLFPGPESPLRFLEDDEAEPDDATKVFESLKGRGLLNPAGSGATQMLLDRLTPVSECSARVILSAKGTKPEKRNFYFAANSGVEYHRDKADHFFGLPRSEAAVAAELAQYFKPSSRQEPLIARLSAGDYLVFAVFARDVRASPQAATGPDAPMSIAEVLAYFDEPEAQGIQAPSDDSWETSIVTLTRLGVIERQGDNYRLQARWHPVACEIVADRQHVVSRYDFLDEQWLVREVSLYPTRDSVFRLGTESDSSVVIEELTTTTLANVLAGVIGTLPNLLNPEAPPVLKHPMLASRPGTSR
jgi:hypothetical protein